MDPKFELLLGWLFYERMEYLDHDKDTILANIQELAGISEYEAERIFTLCTLKYENHLYKDC